MILVLWPRLLNCECTDELPVNCLLTTITNRFSLIRPILIQFDSIPHAQDTGLKPLIIRISTPRIAGLGNVSQSNRLTSGLTNVLRIWKNRPWISNWNFLGRCTMTKTPKETHKCFCTVRLIYWYQPICCTTVILDRSDTKVKQNWEAVCHTGGNDWRV